MKKFKILWLDDFFGPITDVMDEDTRKSHNNFQDKVNELVEDYPDIEFVTIYSINQFFDITDLHQYQAIIFDLRGLNPEDSQDTLPIHQALEIIGNKDILTYIFSANTDAGEYTNDINKIRQLGRCFSKNDSDKEYNLSSYECLMRKVYQELTDSMYLFEGKEECLRIFNNNWVDSSEETLGWMKNILNTWDKKEVHILPADDMRKICEMIAKKLIGIGLLPINTPITIKQWTKYFTDSFIRKDDTGTREIEKDITKRDYNNPYVPFVLCDKGVRVMMEHAAATLDNQNHYYSTIKDKIIREKIWNSAFDAFFVIIRWFDWFMHICEKYNGDWQKYIEDRKPQDIQINLPNNKQSKSVTFVEGKEYKGILIYDKNDSSIFRVFVDGANFPPQILGPIPNDKKINDDVIFIAHKDNSYWYATNIK